jgi:hypothetical protein
MKILLGLFLLVPALASAQAISVQDVTRQIEAGMAESRASIQSDSQHRQQMSQQQDQHRAQMQQHQNIQTESRRQEIKSRLSDY